jgi:hypothetical protein
VLLCKPLYKLYEMTGVPARLGLWGHGMYAVIRKPPLKQGA